jgi:hypothetical protein
MDAIKLIASPFEGDKKKLKEFIENADVAFELVNPVEHGKLLKFVKAKITGEARAKLMVRDESNSWEQVRAILEENYATRRTLDYYACTMFNSRQLAKESIANWASRIDTMQTDLRNAAAKVVGSRNIAGAISLINHLAKACFVQGLENERIQTIVRNRGDGIFLPEATDVALEEESAILSAKERNRVHQRSNSKCENCGKMGHLLSDCYLRKNKVENKAVRALSGIKCFNCKKIVVGHMMKDCKAPRKNGDRRRWENQGERASKSNDEVRQVRSVNIEKDALSLSTQRRVKVGSSNY